MPDIDQIEREIAALIQAKVLNRRLLLEGAFGLSKRTGFDVAQVELDVETRKATVWTGMESHHNGDTYNGMVEPLEWGEALRAVYPTIRNITWKWLKVKREEETLAQREAELETAYKKLVGEPEAKTFFDRLLEA